VRNLDLQDVARISELGGLGATSPEKNVDVVTQHDTLTGRRNMSRQSGLLLSFQGNQPLEAPSNFRRKAYFAGKRVLDIVLAGGALLLLSPALLTIALAIRITSPGNALFRQPRIGYRGKTFTILKFRTMYTDRSDIGGSRQASLDDDRVTPLGRVLRRGSLDELPQLLNIMLGDMSLVGPRPYPLDMLIEGRRYEDLAPYYWMRHSVLPGLSGWAQANGLRGATDSAAEARNRLDHDIAYVQNASLLLDLAIVLKTVRREFLHKGTGY
jgi:lipopolysaccharide/colanic/teichoic acid biosynthesis glycosyltransferase